MSETGSGYTYIHKDELTKEQIVTLADVLFGGKDDRSFEFADLINTALTIPHSEYVVIANFANLYKVGPDYYFEDLPSWGILFIGFLTININKGLPMSIRLDSLKNRLRISVQFQTISQEFSQDFILPPSIATIDAIKYDIEVMSKLSAVVESGNFSAISNWAIKMLAEVEKEAWDKSKKGEQNGKR